MTLEIMPNDQHNQELVGKLHPADWVNPKPIERYNLVVIGAGPAGLVAAVGAAGLGAKVALVERHLMGGDCLNYGCVPSKALLRAAHGVHAARQADGFGLSCEGTVPVDFAKIMKGLRAKRNGLADHDSVARFTSLGVDVFLGEGSFVNAHEITVAGQSLKFHRAVIATGARASLPPIPGLESVNPLINESLFSLTELPKSLIVVGAGPIGCEMAQAFSRFGAKVTLIEMADRPLPVEDPDASAVVMDQLIKDGVELILGVKIIRAEKNTGNKSIILQDGDGERAITADDILVAAGRSPNVEGLNLEAAGIGYHAKGVTVNERLQTTNGKIFAAGDICSRYQFTHSADAMAKIVIQNALFFGRKKVTDLVMPWVTYTSPEVAHVGMTASEAAAAGDKVITYTEQMAGIDRAVLEQETDGFARVHVDRGSGRVLGATMVSSHAGESLSEMTLAITAGLKISAVGGAIHPYPTQAEVWKKLANAHLKQSFTPRIAKIFKYFLSLFSKDTTEGRV